MKKLIGFAFVITMSFPGLAFSQIPKFLAPVNEAGYMGLWDWGGSVGYFNHSERRTLLNNNYEESKTGTPFFKFHFQESLLSNYFWARNQDMRIKFGVVEMIEMGAGYATTKVTSDAPFNPAVDPKSEFNFIFTYEGGLGGVYRINNKMDAGLNYYFFTLSSFYDKNNDNPAFAKFRFRYSHLMVELSAIGKNAIDIKYLRKGEEDRSYTSYIGFNYTGYSHNSEPAGAYVHTGSYMSVTIGGIF